MQIIYLTVTVKELQTIKRHAIILRRRFLTKEKCMKVTGKMDLNLAEEGSLTLKEIFQMVCGVTAPL
jgi:hypothetical protein